MSLARQGRFADAARTTPSFVGIPRPGPLAVDHLEPARSRTWLEQLDDSGQHHWPGGAARVVSSAHATAAALSRSGHGPQQPRALPGEPTGCPATAGAY